jgi:hypothetical protein
MLKEPERFGYSPVSRRPAFTWPDGKRLALYVSVNVEHFPWGQNSGPDLDRPTMPWSQRSWLWRRRRRSSSSSSSSSCRNTGRCSLVVTGGRAAATL